MGPFEIILVVVLLLVIGVGVWGVTTYNGFVRQRNLIQESWRQIDVELNRRYELIPNLIETVRGFAAHERNTLEGITQLRNQAMALAAGGGASQQRVQVEEQLSGAVRNLLVSVEAYPDLKSNVNFLQLQRELTETEDRIAAGRRFYNANVRNYNTRVESLPSNFIANVAKFEKATYFEVNEAQVRRAPEVNFGELSYRPEAPQAPQATPPQLGQQPNTGGMPYPQAYDAAQYQQQPQGYQQQPSTQQPPAQQPYQPPQYGPGPDGN